MKKLVSIGIILLLLVNSCREEFSFNESISFDEQLEVSEDAITKFQSLLTENSPEESRILLKDFLKGADGIADAGISIDSITVWWKLENGIEYCLVTETKASITEISNKGTLEYPYNITENLTFKSMGFPHNNKALLLSPYEWDWSLLGLKPAEDETYFIDNILTTAEFSTVHKTNVNKEDQNISMQDFKNFDDYGVVAISSHGGIRSNGDVFIATGVIATSELYQQYKNDLINNNLTLVVYIDKWFSKDITAFAVTPGWFEKEYPDELENTLFYAGICDGLYNNTLANEIVGDGSAYFSWTKSVDVAQSAKTGRDLFTQLVSNGFDCKDSYEKLVANGNSIYDPVLSGPKKTAEFKYNGDDELRLVEKPIKIGVTPAYFDDIGALLSSLGYIINTISLSDLLDYNKIATYDILAINCASGLDALAGQAKNNIISFVQNGGKLYTSDWAYIFVKTAFPDFVQFPTSPKIGTTQTITATITDEDLRKYLGNSSAEVVYDLGSWVVISSVGSNTRILISGDVSTYSKAAISENPDRYNELTKSEGSVNLVCPLAVSFQYGKGRVVYTTFHNEAQISDPIKHILEYFTILE